MSKINQNELRIALFQTDIIWEDIDANLGAIEEMVAGIDEPLDLILLPETFTTGFTMNIEKNVDADGRTVRWMQKIARSSACAISGTVIVKEGESCFNRHFLVQAGGEVTHYDKRHLFRIGGERDSFTPGNSRVIVKLGPFRILLQICYDLRFPVFSRYQGDYDAIIYAANWPCVRHHVWETLLKARAIENQAYVIGVNRSGFDGEGLAYAGGSCLINPLGILQKTMKEAPGIMVQSMNINKVTSLRENFPVSEGADRFLIEG